VPLSAITNLAQPPDLLKRFVPALLEMRLQVGGVDVLMQTNDSLMLDAVRDFETDSPTVQQAFVWKLVRDEEVQAGPSEPMVIQREPVVVVSLGPACLIGVDSERRELLAFIGGGIDDRAFRSFILPALRHLMEYGPAAANAGGSRLYDEKTLDAVSQMPIGGSDA